MTLWQIAEDMPPPERHADRVVAELLRDLARKRALVGPAIYKVFSESKDGGPRAQARLRDRIKAAGAVFVNLKPGTRGRYQMVIEEAVGWDPETSKEIVPGSSIPTKPWMAWLVTLISDRGRSIKTRPALLVTHHALSRAAQRFGLRTAEHIVAITANVWLSVIGDADGGLPIEKWKTVPPQGHHVRVPGDVIAVLRLYEEDRLPLVVTTFLWDRSDDSRERYPLITPDCQTGPNTLI